MGLAPNPSQYIQSSIKLFLYDNNVDDRNFRGLR